MSMTKLEPPARMTVVEAQEKFYPNSYLMINCEVDNGVVIAGEVAAYAPLKNQGPLIDYADEVSLGGNFGRVVLRDTKDPADGI